MNFQLINISPQSPNDEDLRHPSSYKPSHFIRTDAFTVLPPFSPQIPGPPPTPDPYRILPPIVSRKRPSFVIVQEVGSRPVSREPSPSGRVSPFRGCGFKPHSRETSPARPLSNGHRSRSRLPIAVHKSKSRRVSHSVSPVGSKESAIPRPLNRHISYSPDRAAQILKMVKDVPKNRTKSLTRALESSENTRNLRNGEGKTTFTGSKELLRSSTLNLRQQKPALPQGKNTRVLKSPRRGKPSSSTPASPMDLRPTRYDPKKKSSDNLRPKEGAGMRRSAISSGINPISIDSRRPKENLLPGSSPVRTAKSLRPLVKSPLKSPKFQNKSIKQPGTQTSKKRPPEESAKKAVPEESPSSDKVIEELTPSVPTKSEPSTRPSTPKPNDKFSAVKSVGKKALTTSNLLSALKNKKKEDEKLESTAKNHGKGSDKKDLNHTDTSWSLPMNISIGTSGLTESSVTMIRTTTEPALAPVEPELISEIRSAISNSLMNDDTQCTKHEMPAITSEPVAPPSSADNMEEPKQKSVAEEMVKTEKAEVNAITKKTKSENSPRPTHVIAVTKILEEPRKVEITSKVVNIAHKVENEVLGSNDSLLNENRNGISKSSWLNKDVTAEPMKKPLPKLMKQKHSTKCLVTTEKPTRWKKFTSQCSKRVRNSDKQQLPITISTISKGLESEKLPLKKSCLEKYFRRFCYKCRLRKHQRMTTVENLKNRSTAANNRPKSPSKMRCLKCGNCFKNLFGKMTYRQNEIIKKKCTKTNEVAAAPAELRTLPKRSCCASCRHAVARCFGIFCCWNTSACVRLRSKCGKWCTCCKKCCSCCRAKQKTVITESERRRSTISTTRKRKWTKVLTDFPKLDPSFVDHASIMRGAIPVLPVSMAWICLILNIFLPGLGTLSSGIFCLFVGKPRFSINDSLASRFGALLVNLLVAGSQLFTVLFCLVGWGWSIWWGVMMLRMARKNKRVMMAEQAANRPLGTSTTDQRRNHDVERGRAI